MKTYRNETNLVLNSLEHCGKVKLVNCHNVIIINCTMVDFQLINSTINHIDTAVLSSFTLQNCKIAMPITKCSTCCFIFKNCNTALSMDIIHQCTIICADCEFWKPQISNSKNSIVSLKNVKGEFQKENITNIEFNI